MPTWVTANPFQCPKFYHGEENWGGLVTIAGHNSFVTAGLWIPLYPNSICLRNEFPRRHNGDIPSSFPEVSIHFLSLIRALIYSFMWQTLIKPTIWQTPSSVLRIQTGMRHSIFEALTQFTHGWRKPRLSKCEELRNRSQLVRYNQGVIKGHLTLLYRIPLRFIAQSFPWHTARDHTEETLLYCYPQTCASHPSHTWHLEAKQQTSQKR